MSIPMVPLTIGEATSGTLVINDLTTGELGGTGVFDVLMSVVAKYLLEEYTKNRITGKEYATVYLGSMTAVLQQAIAYLTANKQVEKLNSEIGLLRQKTVTELAQTDDDIPVGLGFNNGLTIEGVSGKQNDLYAAQTTGFTRDAEQKIMAEVLKTWAVRRTTDEGTVVPSNINDAAINAVIAKAVTGIGITSLL